MAFTFDISCIVRCIGVVGYLRNPASFKELTLFADIQANWRIICQFSNYPNNFKAY